MFFSSISTSWLKVSPGSAHPQPGKSGISGFASSHKPNKALRKTRIWKHTTDNPRNTRAPGTMLRINFANPTEGDGQEENSIPEYYDKDDATEELPEKCGDLHY